MQASVKIGTIQRRLAWPLRKDDTRYEKFHHFFSLFLPLSRSMIGVACPRTPHSTHRSSSFSMACSFLPSSSYIITYCCSLASGDHRRRRHCQSECRCNRAMNNNIIHSTRALLLQEMIEATNDQSRNDGDVAALRSHAINIMMSRAIE